jgi:hypothetical protein
MSIDSRRQRCCVRSERNHVIDIELFNASLHEGASNTRPAAVLKIVELADDIARRTARYAGYRPEPFQVAAMTGVAR